MNKKERQGIADAFRACLPYLWDGVVWLEQHSGAKHKFICHAITDSKHPSSGAAKRLIEQRLDGCSTLGNWLASAIGGERFDAEFTDERMQAHRKAWVLQLIEEFES